MSELLETRFSRIRFSVLKAGADRVHHVNPEDVRVVLGRLPLDLWGRLRGVHFNDMSRGGRILGYITSAHREIALCALPPRISIWVRGSSPLVFGAQRNQKWPLLAVRRYMLYDVLLHELGHLQMIDENRASDRLRFAREKLAQSFAVAWRKRLWSAPFPHPDPVHNPPGVDETGARGSATGLVN
jgi:hypothetical protein